MIVSFNWLKDYAAIDVPAEELTRRLMLAGLNHEETSRIGEDLAIDLEVTSNRPDCLGHIGIAREAAVLLSRQLKLPEAKPREGKAIAAELTRVTLDCTTLCPRYTARVIRGVKVGPSPTWLVARLATLGIAAINNVVDITNYVLMETGQPLHAFDLAKLEGREIIVRAARPCEPFEAINHKSYELEAGMCVIADRRRAVAIGGVMGGADTEVSAGTADLLIESAEFASVSIRATARRLNLHSDSSYRFERGVDPNGVDWASRRACELILELAGGELASGVVDVGRQPVPREPVVLRLSQLKRILGIEIDPAEVRRILASLGNREVRADAEGIEVVPPSWRRDLSREIDLVEEVARIHGYDAIPEDVGVPMAASARGRLDLVLAKVRQVLAAAGVDEAMTISVVEPAASEAFSPWTDAAPLQLSIPILRRADLLRRSLIPSLLIARRTNETLANPPVELFETARTYLPREGELPIEEMMLAITSGRDFFAVKGILEAVLESLNPAAALEVTEFQHKLFAPGRACELRLAGERFGYVGEIGVDGLKQFELRGPSTVAEVRVALLESIANLAPQASELSPYPAVERDVNLVLAEQVRWGAVAATIQAAAGENLEQLVYRDTYRDPERLGIGKKSFLFTLILRGRKATLTSAEADQARDAVVAACAKAHGAQLRA
ncbi:MAG TPA: phenylalanine--tRNA ligase subunit beta [Pirellulales bacterium]|jgi:phenylalanyl-tRNA synthetase beta chain|nr:phenylalanine--tRNA ligase subunit beta [Pirellulales bacterium]